jgi:tetratricopeptide (TPR) repeat protein
VPVAAIALLSAGGALAVWKPWNRVPEAAAPVAVMPAKATPVRAGEPTVVLRQVAPAKKQPDDNHPARSISSPPEVTPLPLVSKAEVPTEQEDDAELPLPPPVAKSATNPTPFETAILRGHEQMRSRDYPGAIQSFTKAIGLRPNYAPAYFSLGAAHQNLDQNEAAVQNYSEAIRLAPEMALAFAGRGVCLVRLRRDPDALADFQRALELKPDLASALNGRGGIHFRRKHYRMALADFDAAIKSNPRLARAYLNRARTKETMGDPRSAADDRQRGEELRKR